MCRSVICKRTKLMLVGLGEAGKTSLLHALIDKSSHHERPPITDGIDIKEWSVPLPDNTSLVYSMYFWLFYLRVQKNKAHK